MLNDCVFCNINENDVIEENNSAIAIFDNYPVNKGHSLIIPKRHYPDFFQATKQEIIDFYDLICKMKTIIEKKFNPDGYNLGINIGKDAGQTIFHLHIHLIPRYKGDIDNPRGGVRGIIPSKRFY